MQIYFPTICLRSQVFLSFVLEVQCTWWYQAKTKTKTKWKTRERNRQAQWENTNTSETNKQTNPFVLKRLELIAKSLRIYQRMLSLQWNCWKKKMFSFCLEKFSSLIILSESWFVLLPTCLRRLAIEFVNSVKDIISKRCFRK